MNKKQYNNVIEHTLKHEVSAQTEDSLETARAIFNNMGVALPQGDIKHVYEVIQSDDYMGWKSCTMQEAQEAANNGTAAIGISEDRIVVLAANDEEEPVTETASVMTLSENTSAYAVDGLSYATYSNGTTIATAKKENVTITKDGSYNKVIFESSGKVWYCINKDLIYNEENRKNKTLTNRSAKNLYFNYNEDDPFSSDKRIRIYSNSELRLLYAIDPYGVAHYIQCYADKEYNSIKDKVDYKDSIFKMLFKRSPMYFERISENEWCVVVQDDIEIQEVLSESEAYFGTHPLFDEITKRQISLFIFNIILSLVGNILAIKNVAKDIMTAYKLSTVVLSMGGGSFIGELGAGTNEGLLGYALDEYKLDWAWNLVSTVTDITDILDSTMVEPNFYSLVLEYCAYDTNYNVYVELKNGRKHKLDEICTVING